jgi:hypothetical protein
MYGHEQAYKTIFKNAMFDVSIKNATFNFVKNSPKSNYHFTCFQAVLSFSCEVYYYTLCIHKTCLEKINNEKYRI